MNRFERETLRMRPIKHLRELLEDLRRDILLIQEVIEQKEASLTDEEREAEIASLHTGAPELVQRVRLVEGNKSTGKWDQCEYIYCSNERCPRCPHGPFWFRYRSNKKKRSFSVRFISTPVFDLDLIDKLHEHVREPIMRGDIILKSPDTDKP